MRQSVSNHSFTSYIIGDIHTNIGVAAVLGDLEDSGLITGLTVASDVVFHLATADHLKSAEAILAGVKERAANGLSTIYLHQSGASCLSDARDGVPVDNLNDKVYSDEKPEELDALPESAPHKHIDRAIIKVRNELGEKAKIFIMMPGIIYGTNSYGRLSIQVGHFTGAGLGNPRRSDPQCLDRGPLAVKLL